MKKNQKDPKARRIPFSFRVSVEEMQMLLAYAHKYTKGDVSKWIRKKLFS